MEMTYNFIQAIDTYKRTHNLRQEDLAQKIGTTQSHLSRILKAKRVSERYYHIICDVIGYDDSRTQEQKERVDQRRIHISMLFTAYKFKEAEQLSYEALVKKYGFTSTLLLVTYFEDASRHTDFFFYIEESDHHPMKRFIEDSAKWAQRQLPLN